MAGILPVAIDKGKLYFLFGKEYKYADIEGWSDFGGSKEKNETKFETAIREGYEETNGFFGSKHNLQKNIEKFLLLEIKSKTYSCFLYKIKYDTNLVKYYNRNYKFINKHNTKFVKDHNGYYEKSSIKWFTIEDICENRQLFRKWYNKTIIPKIIKLHDKILKNIKKY